MLEKEVIKVRLRIVDLIKSFFVSEPDAEKLSRWRGTFNALASESVGGEFDRQVAALRSCLQGKSLEKLQEEYYKLFTDPFTDKGLQTSASYYLNGRSHGKTLVDIRTLLMEAGIERNAGIVETEDSLVVMLDIYARLVEEEASGGGVHHQEQLLKKFMLPFAEKLSESAQANELADFYRHCCHFCHCYLEMEMELMGVTAQEAITL